LDNAVQKPVYLPSVPATRRTFLCRDSDLHPIVLSAFL
jgi:hypothetical protein